MRPYPGKERAIILDHAGNTERHCLPDDVIEWSLSGRPKVSRNSDSQGISVKICPQCKAAQPPGLTACRFCRSVFHVKHRVIDQEDGELVEVDPDLIRRQRRAEQGQAQTIEELVAVGIKRGFKRPRLWAQHVWRARRSRGRA